MSAWDSSGLVGPPGPTGPQGPAGAAGAPGPAGASMLAQSIAVQSTYNLTGQLEHCRYTFGAGQLKAGDRVRLNTWAYAQNPTSAVYYTYRFKFGSTVFMTSPGVSNPVAAGLAVIRTELEIHLETITGVRARAWILVGSPSSTGASAAATMVADAVQYSGNAALSNNFGAVTDLVMTVQPDRALGDAYLATAGWWLQHFPSP